MEGIFAGMAMCIGIICTLVLSILVFLTVTQEYRKKVDVQELRKTQLVSIVISLIIGCGLTYWLISGILAGPPSPKWKPRREEAIGTWVLSQSTLDFMREGGYQGLMPGFSLREDGTFVMDGVPAPIMYSDQDVSGRGTWSIEKDSNNSASHVHDAGSHASKCCRSLCR